VTSAVPVTEVLPALDVDLDVEHPWVAIVWNDPVNLMTYVTYIFQTLLGHPKPKAEKLMMDVHRRGRATVANGTREEMEIVVTKLQAAGLWATMAHDK
jgi:ATP-dependent Clp protease adaptor protein ClpS